MRHMLGTMDIELTDDRLIHRTALTESRLHYNGIERVGRTDDYLFIFIGAGSAHVVPRRAASADEYEAFIDTLNQRIELPIESGSIPASENAPPPAPKDAKPEPMRMLIEQYLYDRDMPCPACGYNLRSTRGSSCPECGARLELNLQQAGDPPSQTYWLLAVIVNTGFGVMLFFHAVWTILTDVIASGPHLLAIAFAIASPVILIIVMRSRDRFIRLPRLWQWNIAILLAIGHLLAAGAMLGAASL